MRLTKLFMGKRWLDFRNGHSFYLAFVLTFGNFILITYNLAVERVALLNDIFDNIWIFVAAFLCIYVPLAMLIGYIHRRKQYAVDNEAMIQENWIGAWIGIYQIRLLQGKATPQETKRMLDYVEGILKRHKKA